MRLIFLNNTFHIIYFPNFILFFLNNLLILLNSYNTLANKNITTTTNCDTHKLKCFTPQTHTGKLLCNKTRKKFVEEEVKSL